jgi:hypothetical protein
MSTNTITKSVHIPLEKGAYHFLAANNQRYDIEIGQLHTDYLDNGNVQWDWVITLKLKPKEVIALNKKCAILYDDYSTFVDCQAIERTNEGQFTSFKLVPYFGEQ